MCPEEMNRKIQALSIATFIKLETGNKTFSPITYKPPKFLIEEYLCNLTSNSIGNVKAVQMLSYFNVSQSSRLVYPKHFFAPVFKVNAPG